MADHLTIVLLGNTGVGKSASGNTILGQTAFESKRSFKSVTTKISEATETVLGRQISVVDTPGILCDGAGADIQTYCEDLLHSCRPCLFLVVIKIDRFTEEQQRAVKAAIRVVGEHGLNKTYLLFTGGDTLDMTLEDFIHEDDECPLPQLVERLEHRYLLFNNKHGGQEQVRELLEKSATLPRSPVPLEDRRIVLFGTSGVGKSSSGNTILGSEKFRSDCDFESVSVECASESAVVEGRQVTVMDTPGFTDPRLRPEHLGQRIINTIKESSPGIHAFVIVVKINRISEAEAVLLEQLPTLFGSNAAKYTMVLFTHGDLLRGQSIDDKILISRRVSELVSMCCGRYCVFDNTQRRNRQQVREFLDKIDEMVTANGGQPCPVNMLDMLIKDVSSPPRSGQIVQFKMLPEETPRQTASRARGVFEKISDFIDWLVRFFSNLFTTREGYSRVPQALMSH